MADPEPFYRSFTSREVYLLRELIRARAEEAAAVSRRWRAEPVEGYTDGAEALATERNFAEGRALAWAEFDTLIKDVANQASSQSGREV